MSHYSHWHGGGYYVPYGGGYPYNDDNYGRSPISNVVQGLVNILPEIFGGQRRFGAPPYMDAGAYQNPQGQWGQYQQPATGYPLPNVDIRNPIERDAAIDSQRIGNSLSSGQQADLSSAQRHLDRALRIDQRARSHGRQTDFFGQLVQSIDRDLQQSMGGRYRFVDNQSTGWQPRIVDTQASYYQNDAAVTDTGEDNYT
jgi:hypothetical protein